MEGKELWQIMDRKLDLPEVLNRRRPLTLQMIRAIHRAWSIPLESLIGTKEHAA
jgi:antitoxin component HigA of HigAB toxin-antitoxin module